MKMADGAKSKLGVRKTVELDLATIAGTAKT